jgi:hypothetical protein
MWVFPLLASGVAFVFAGRLFADYARRRQPYQLAWAIALAMYGVASFVVVLGGLNGWSDREFAVYWALGAVLNVPFLAGGELMLLVRNTAFRWAVWRRGGARGAAPIGQRCLRRRQLGPPVASAHLDPVLRRPRGRRAVVGLAHARQTRPA